MGPDGSSGHEFGKRITEKSLLDGAAMVTTFCSIQFVTEVGLNTIILYTNRLLGAADQVRPWHINVVPESPGELINIFRLDVIKKIIRQLKSKIPENTSNVQFFILSCLLARNLKNQLSSEL